MLITGKLQAEILYIHLVLSVIASLHKVDETLGHNWMIQSVFHSLLCRAYNEAQDVPSYVSKQKRSTRKAGI